MIIFKNFSQYERGILYSQLADAYSFDRRWHSNFERDWKEYDEFFYDNLKFTDKCGFIMELGGEPIGHISWDPRNLPEYVIIGHNCILTAYKGRGYGKILLSEAIKRIKEYENIRKIIVTTNESLISAQKNYEGAGFLKVRERINNETPFFGCYMDYEIKI